MNLNNLIAFVKAAEYHSITKAAEELYVTQQTLSQRIMVLEEELGVPLFIHGKPLQLTAQGERCLPEAQKVLSYYELLKAAASEKVEGLRGILRIGYPNGMRINLLADALQEYARINQQVQIDLRPMLFGQMITDFKEDKLDVFFSGKNVVKTLKNVNYIDILKNPLTVLVSKDHRLADRKKIDITELRDEAFIVGERRTSPGGIDHQIEICMKNGFSPNIKHIVSDMNALKIYVAIGKGVAFASTLDETGFDIGIRRIEIEGSDDFYDLVCIFKQNEDRPVVLEYIKILNGIFSEEAKQ